MQQNTESIAPIHHSFVPWIELNGRSLLEMQVYQLFLADKLKIWTSNVADRYTRSPKTNAANESPCRTPPDFWCDNDAVTRECFDNAKCASYRASTLGQPINITVMFNSHCNNSHQFVVDMLYSKVWKNRKLRKLVSIQLVPWGKAKRFAATGDVKCAHGPEECLGDTILACAIHHNDKNAFDVVDFTACFMQIIHDGGNNDQALRTCSQFAKISKSLTETIR